MAEPPAVITVTMNTAIDRVLKVPGFAIGRHLDAQLVSHSPAGKGVNLAHALARLGRSVIVTGFVGRADAESFRSSLQSSKGAGRIGGQLIPVPGKTRENITIVDPETKTDTHLRSQGYSLTPKDVSALLTKLSELSGEGAVCVFTGSMPTGLDDGALIGLIKATQQRGARVVLDLNGKILGAVLAALTQPVWMVSPNQAELAEAVGRRGAMDERALLGAVAQLSHQTQGSLISMGREGALLVVGDGAFYGVCEVDANKVINTVSAGDCLLAAVIDARLRGHPPEQALRRALAVATASTFHNPPAHFQMQDLAKLAESAKIKEL